MLYELKPCPVCGNKYVQLIGLKSQNKFTYNQFYHVITCHECDMAYPYYMNFDVNKVREGWNSLPRKLKWTKEKPFIEGFYFYRDTNSKVFVCTVALGETGLFAAYENITTNVYKMDGEWAGPIQEPREAE